MGLNKRERSWGRVVGRGGGGGASRSVRGNYMLTNLTFFEGMHQFTMYILSVVPRVKKGRGVRRGGEKGNFQQLSVAYMYISEELALRVVLNLGQGARHTLRKGIGRTSATIEVHTTFSFEGFQILELKTPPKN